LLRFLAVPLLLLPALALAGSFTAVPVKLTIDSRSKTEVLRIMNDGNEKVTVQLEAKAWSQDETGQDVYADTKDIVFFPKIADIEKGEERIIRIGYQGEKAPSTEKTYRLYLAELPVTSPGELALKFALRLGIPIFVSPRKENREWAVDKVGISEESLRVSINNSGNTHAVVSKIMATGLDASGKEVFSRNISGWYVLAGVSKPFAVDVSRQECLSVRTINVTAEAGKIVRDTTLNVDRTMCTPKHQQIKKKMNGVSGGE